MNICTCWLLALLLTNPVSPEAVSTDALRPPEPDLLISRNEALADISQLCAVLVVEGADDTKSMVDYENLQVQVVDRLKTVGIEHVDCRTGQTPRLHIQIETVLLSDCGRCVFRVQAALSRIVTFTDHRELQVQADVWRLRPTMKAVTEAEVADSVTAAVLTQVEAFAGAYQAACRLQKLPAGQDTDDPSAQEVGQVLYVASKNSSVFHRADCRMARNISEKNLVTYESREEAVRDGKRPCKTCTP